jgi:hypothetical protein
MRLTFALTQETLKRRMAQPFQVEPQETEAEMPPYMESFLAHLRVLVGVPFEYLIADPRLLPDESIRFFYLDRSWADRLVDGAIAVGKVGTREQAHHQAHAAPVTRQLDLSERIVRALQQGIKPFAVDAARASGVGQFVDIKKTVPNVPAGTVTGLLLRSAAVSGWPHMEIRAYKDIIKVGTNASSPEAQAAQLKTLRMERLAPAVILALFDGVPKLVHIEEPHHGVQFGIQQIAGGPEIPLRTDVGKQIAKNDDETKNEAETIPVPVRAADHRVIHVAQLLKDLKDKRAAFVTKGRPNLPIQQTGSAAFAIAVLNPPWRQRFEGVVDHAEKAEDRGGSGRFVAMNMVTAAVQQPVLIAEVKKLFTV